ncbi:hypothetical protein WDW89_18610 [Deltaproteobacteria bacterium TL4]
MSKTARITGITDQEGVYLAVSSPRRSGVTRLIPKDSPPISPLSSIPLND